MWFVPSDLHVAISCKASAAEYDYPGKDFVEIALQDLALITEMIGTLVACWEAFFAYPESLLYVIMLTCQ